MVARKAYNRESATGVDATGSTSTNVDYGHNSATASASAEGGFSAEVVNSKGYGVGFSINAQATTTHDVKTEDGVTTYTANAEASVTLQGQVNTPQAGLEIAHTDGIQLEYQVSMPEEYATPEAMANATYVDPSTMPVGTVIRIDDSQYSTNEFSASFQSIRLSSKVTESEGASFVVEKTGETTVRVTTGPTSGIDAYNGVGIDVGVASISIGNNTSLDSATFQTAEFDLSTADGQAAYNHFLATGEMPADNGPGVSDVQTIEKLDYNSATDIEGSIGPIDFGLSGIANTGNSVRITQPDGTSVATSTFVYGDNVPITITHSFDANGEEIIEQRTYSYEIETSESNYQLLNVVSTGDVNQATTGPVQPGQTVVVTMTHAQMQEMQGLAVESLDGNERPDLKAYNAMALDGNGNPVDTTQFAINMARFLNQTDIGIAEVWFSISSSADGNEFNDDYTALPMQIEVKD